MDIKAVGPVVAKMAKSKVAETLNSRLCPKVGGATQDVLNAILQLLNNIAFPAKMMMLEFGERVKGRSAGSLGGKVLLHLMMKDPLEGMRNLITTLTKELEDEDNGKAKKADHVMSKDEFLRAHDKPPYHFP